MPGRCFIAVDLPESARAALGAAQTFLQDAAPDWRGEKWVGEDLLHVTLAFLGAVADPALEATLAALGPAAATSGPFDVRLTGVRAIPNTRRASMLWATADTTCDLGPLRDALLDAAGCSSDDRPFRSHVTLVRARRPKRIDAAAIAASSEILSAYGKGPDGSVSVRSLTVYASTLGPGGPAYEPLALLPLRSSEDDTGPIDTEHVFA